MTEKGIQVKSPMNSLEEEQVAMVEDKFGKERDEAGRKGRRQQKKRKHLLKRKILHRYFIRRTAVQVSDAAQEDHKIEQKDSRDAETTARIIDRMVRHRIVTVRTAQVSRNEAGRDGQNGRRTFP